MRLLSLLLFLGSWHSSFSWCLAKHLSRGMPPSLFSSKLDDVAGSAVIATAADITDLISKESVAEMEKVAEIVQTSWPESKRSLLMQTNDEFSSYVRNNSIENFLFDCDGVLYRGTDAMPCASQTIQQLIDRGKRVFFVTNNAASTRMELKTKLEKVLNCKGMLTEEMMIGSAYVAGQYLKSCKLKIDSGNKARVHVIGTSGLCTEIQAAGFDTSGGPDSVETPSGMSRDELAAYPFPEGKIDALVIGLDNDFNYRKLCIATVLLQRNPDALLIATNLDAFDLVGADARHLPGNGALMFTSLMIGDRLDTDITFGNESGMKSALVLTGCTTASELKDDLSNEMVPDLIIPHVGYMLDDATGDN